MLDGVGGGCCRECLCWGETKKKKKKKKEGKRRTAIQFLGGHVFLDRKSCDVKRRNKTALSTQKKLEEKEEKEERKVHSSNQSTTGQGAQITDRSQTDNTHTESRHRN